MTRWGVSPAWMISCYGGEFGPAETAVELPRIAAAGFQTVQLETFLVERIREWENGGAEILREALTENGIAAEVFVGHCLLGAFASPEALGETVWTGTARRIAAAAAAFDGVGTVSVPLPPLGGDAPDRTLFGRLEEQWRRVTEPFGEAGLKTAVEILPGSPAATADGLERLLQSGAFAGTALNFDSGHFNAAGFDLPGLLRHCGERVGVTHLCDNDGVVNSSSPPGDGTVPWTEVVGALRRSGYAGSWDIEIVCDPGEIVAIYRKALNFLSGPAWAAEETIESKE